ncbi:MAG: hypothetical protein HY332_25985 [Chloroflexi bacterium]|nr:hypothetical protein [Chloroflexota bacterium]
MIRSRNWGSIVSGVVIMGLTPNAFWSSANLVWANQQLGPAAGIVMGFGGVALFALGWLLVGAGLRPGRSALRGALLGAASYLGAGLTWAAVYASTNSFGDRLGPDLLAVVPVWPLHASFVQGLFGLGQA